MKKILTLMLLSALLLSAVASAGPPRSKVLVVNVVSTADWGDIVIAYDLGWRYRAQVFQILDNRNIDLYYHTWDGDTTALKVQTLDKADDYDFAIFVGGNRADMDYTVGGGEIYRWIEPDTNYCKIDKLWWSFPAGVSDAKYDIGTASNSGKLDVDTHGKHFYTASYSGELDTFMTYTARAAVNQAVGLRNDTPVVDSILTFTGYPDGTEAHWLGVWSITDDGVTAYYTSLLDGTAGIIVDALICKHCTYFDPLYFALDIDDFGMHKHTTTSTFPNTDNLATDANFWTPIDELFQTIEDYELKLTVGVVAKHVRGYHADSNQWDKWWDLAQTWKDSNHLAWAWHNHGEENPDDESSATFYRLQAYQHFNIVEGSSATTVARMDSLYEDAIDSMEAWGLTVAPYIMPPWDAVAGVYEDLKDTIATMCAQNSLALRSKYGEAGVIHYRDTADWLGCKVLNAHYMTNTSDTTLLDISNIAYVLWNSFWGPSFFFSFDMTGQNPDIATAHSWNVGRALLGNMHTPRNSRVTVFHFGACKNDNRNVQIIEYIGQTIDYLEWLSGKDLYECKFAHELAHEPKCWRQVK